MKKPKVLLVDDEQDYIQALANRLTLRGFDVDVAHSGEEALRKVATEASREQPPEPLAVASSEEQPTKGPTKVLLVDDEQDFVQALAERLTLRGFDVEVAFSGEEALDKACNTSFHVIVLDYKLPGMDGIETLIQLREHDPKSRFLLLTGQATIKAATKATRLGAVDILEKPTDIVTLVERLHAASTASL